MTDEKNTDSISFADAGNSPQWEKHGVWELSDPEMAARFHKPNGRLLKNVNKSKSGGFGAIYCGSTGLNR